VTKLAAALKELGKWKSLPMISFLENIHLYIESGKVEDVLVSAFSWESGHGAAELGKAIGSSHHWDKSEIRVAEYGFHLLKANAGKSTESDAARLFSAICSGLTSEESPCGQDSPGHLFFEMAENSGVSPAVLGRYLLSGRYGPWRIEQEIDGQPIFTNELRNYFWRQSDKTLSSVIGEYNSGMLLLARYRPQVIRFYLDGLNRRKAQPRTTVWSEILGGKGDFIEDALKAFENARQGNHRWTILEALVEHFPARFKDFAVKKLGDLSLVMDADAMKWLTQVDPDLAIRQLTRLIEGQQQSEGCYSSTFDEAARRLERGGLAVFEATVAAENPGISHLALAALAKCAPAQQHDRVEDLARLLIKDPHPVLAEEMWKHVQQITPPILIPEQWTLLGNKSKKLRLVAVAGLATALGAGAIPDATALLRHKKADVRLGSVALLAELDTAEAMAAIRSALEKETSDTVRALMFEALSQTDVPGVSSEPEAGLTLRQLEASLPKSNKEKASILWLDPEKLPPLFAADGMTFSSAALAFILDKQSKHKNIEPAPDVLPWLTHVDRARSGDFALALLNAWLAEGQDAKHRWVLALAGTLGDSRIISTLLPWIPKWCEAARHKLAEYAVQGISLLASNEALMVLDTLATRYRSKFRNVGAAAAAAFQAAATARGMSPDDLGDLVVPAFGFDEAGQRRFEWEGGAATAELTMDLKLEWSDPETDKSWKALPAGASDAVKSEVKELGKLLREAGKSQALRLEHALVKQRRWPVAAWRDLYEKHPLLRIYATRLVWAVYDRQGQLLRTFRRYPNGLLADALGALEELPEAEAAIGLVHPLELDPSGLQAWQAHLSRFKVVPPFPQLERPVERCEPTHHNRRQLSTAEGQEISYATFRSRAEKRGWVRGSVVDAGGISSYYKLFPGAGVEVSLDTGDMYVGMDPMETLTLGTTRFCTAGSIQRGSYVYDEPTENDPRILTFSQVPPVVYSETVSDLKAIIARKQEQP